MSKVLQAGGQGRHRKTSYHLKRRKVVPALGKGKEAKAGSHRRE
jgi:hypothetical protein